MNSSLSIATTASANDGYSSSDDSVLSFWSSDESGSDSDDEPDQAKEAERKRREHERGKILSAAGLQLRREPPGVPSGPGQNKVDRKVSRRRPAPATPAKGSNAGKRVPSGKSRDRRKAPSVPKLPASSSTDNFEVTTPADTEPESDVAGINPASTDSEPKLDTHDAYARYEQFLQQSKTRPVNRVRSDSAAAVPIAPPLASQPSGSGAIATSIALSPSMSTSSATGSTGTGGRLSGLFSRIMAPSTSDSSGAAGSAGRKVISGPISRLGIDSPHGATTPGGADSNGAGTPGGADMSGGDTGLGRTWGSLVEPSVLETMGDKERKRQEVGPEVPSAQPLLRDPECTSGLMCASLTSRPFSNSSALKERTIGICNSSFR